jgi:hypothetical protein
MRRDYFTLNVDGASADESGAPAITITYEGPTAELESRLQRGGEPLDADEVDVAYRLREPLEDTAPTGVLAIADRVTGEYILELNAEADAIFDAIDAVDDSDGDGHYRLVITTDESELAAHEKSTLLVYDADGDLRRDRSLIPSGVEI